MLFQDREVFADLVTLYYTEYEPEALWVAECEGQVIGYLTGCLDSRRYRRLRRRMIPQAIWTAIRRGALRSAHTWRWVAAGCRTWRCGGFKQPVSLADYPAHLHVNVLSAFRGQRAGRSLVARFLEQARGVGARGIHAAVRGDNPPSCQFFERMGFSEMYRARVAFPYGITYEWHETIIYGKRL